MSDTKDPKAPADKAKRKAKAPAQVVSLEEARALRESGKWLTLLRLNQHGVLTKDIGNLVLELANSEEWSGCLVFDEFSERMRWARAAPKLPGMRAPDGEVTAQDAVYVHHYFARMRAVSFAKGDVWDAMEAAAKQRPVHAVRDWLGELRWDGTRRVATWLSEYFGAEDDAYTQAVGQWWLISAVARAYRPGCQVDHMLVLEGNQGLGKSRGLEELTGPDWYLGKLPNVQDEVRAVSALRGWWIVEIGELDAFRGAAATRVKDFLTQSHDSFRAAYARLEQRRARSCVFVGTTNEEQYLTDATGARRYWPVKCGIIDRHALRRDRQQLWAEAVALFEGGASWWPDRSDKGMSEALQEAQEARFAVDAWESRIATWLGTQIQRDGFLLDDVMGNGLGMQPGQWTKADQTRVGQALQRLGYEKRRSREGTFRVHRYWRLAPP